MIEKITTKDHNHESIIKDCLRFLSEGLNQANSAFSPLLFWILTIALTTMTLSAYFAISFLFELRGSESFISKIGTLLGSTSIISTVIFINFMSHEVSKNLQKLKYYIYELKSDRKDQIIEMINSFQGFDACGFFILGKPLLTSIVASFTTFIIVLIQFKMAEPSGGSAGSAMLIK